MLPLSVANRANIPELEDEDVVEVPCRIDGNGPRALHVGRVPEAVRALLLRVKDYERLTETSEAFIYVPMSRLMVKRLARS